MATAPRIADPSTAAPTPPAGQLITGGDPNFAFRPSDLGSQYLRVNYQEQVTDMLREAVEAELQFARDLCGDGLPGMNTESMRQYLECVADRLNRRNATGKGSGENRSPFSCGPFI